MKFYKVGSTWYVYHCVGDQRLRKALSPDLQVAKEVAKKLIADLERKRWKIIKEAYLPEIFETFRGYCRVNVTRSTFVSYEDKINHLINFLNIHKRDYTKMKPSDITREMIEGFKEYRLIQQKRLPKTVNNDIAAFHSMFNVAIDHELAESNPFAGTRRLKIDKSKPPRFLSEDEVQILIENASEIDKDLLTTFLLTGMRYGELLHMDWEDIDFENCFIKIQSKEGWKPKSGQSRVVPMLPEVEEILRKRKTNSITTRIFPDETENSFHHRLSKLSKRLGLKRVSPHVLRHTCASHLVMKGVDLTTVKMILGHSDIRTTMIYAHLAQDHIKYSLNKLSFTRVQHEVKPIILPMKASF